MQHVAVSAHDSWRAIKGGRVREAARALTPLLERALMLERSAEREATLVKGTERRLTRLGYDLHDGPIQEVLVLAAEMRGVRDLIFVAPPVLEHEHPGSEGERLAVGMGHVQNRD